MEEYIIKNTPFAITIPIIGVVLIIFFSEAILHGQLLLAIEWFIYLIPLFLLHLLCVIPESYSMLKNEKGLIMRNKYLFWRKPIYYNKTDIKSIEFLIGDGFLGWSIYIKTLIKLENNEVHIYDISSMGNTLSMFTSIIEFLKEEGYHVERTGTW